MKKNGCNIILVLADGVLGLGFELDSWDGEILDSMAGKQDVFCIEIKRLPVNIIQQINDAERIKACYMVPTWDVRDMT